MSQYPAGYDPQYSFMSYYHMTPQQLLAPAKTAGWAMMALGVVLFLGGSCVGAMLYGAPDTIFQDVIREMAKSNQPMPMEVTPRLIRIVYGSMMGVVGVYGILCAIVGLFVRRGGLAWIIIGMVMSAIPLVLVAVMFVVSLTAGIEGVLSAICICSVPAALMVLSLIALIKAMGNTSKIAESERQMAAMYQQQMQQYYAYQQPPMPPS